MSSTKVVKKNPKVDLNRLKNDFKTQFNDWSKFEYLLLIITSIVMIGVTIWMGIDVVGDNVVMNSFPLTMYDIIISLFGSLFILIYLILVGKGRNIGYVYGWIGTIFWGLIALKSQIWLQMILQFAIYIPILTWGTYNWIFKGNLDYSDDSEVKSMSKKSIAFSAVAILALSAGLMWAFKFIPGEAIVYTDPDTYHLDYAILALDTLVLLSSVFTTTIMILGYKQAWSFWIITNTTWMVFYAYMTWGTNNIAMLGGVIGLIAYTLNSIYVYITINHPTLIKRKEK